VELDHWQLIFTD